MTTVPPVVMRLLIDQNVPDSVAEFFRERGHQVEHVRDLFLDVSPDHVIGIVAERMNAIVVTWNHKDFKRLGAQVPKGGAAALRRLSRINFRCEEPRGRKRAEQIIDVIEREFGDAQLRRDKRLLMEIKWSNYTVLR